MLKKTYFPEHSQNRMEDEGNLEKARYNFYKKKPTNLIFLLEKRFSSSLIILVLRISSPPRFFISSRYNTTVYRQNYIV